MRHAPTRLGAAATACATVVVLAAGAVVPAPAAAQLDGPPSCGNVRDGVYGVDLVRLPGARVTVSCAAAKRATLYAIDHYQSQSTRQWRCARPGQSAFPIIERCVRISRGRKVAVARLVQQVE